MGNFSPQIRTLAEAQNDPRGLIKKEINKFKGRWYLDKASEKFIFIWGFVSLLFMIIYGLYLLL